MPVMADDDGLVVNAPVLKRAPWARPRQRLWPCWIHYRRSRPTSFHWRPLCRGAEQTSQDARGGCGHHLLQTKSAIDVAMMAIGVNPEINWHKAYRPPRPTVLRRLTILVRAPLDLGITRSTRFNTSAKRSAETSAILRAPRRAKALQPMAHIWRSVGSNWTMR